MKDLVKRVKSFITFDFPLQTEYISVQFASIHSTCKKRFPFWNPAATRKKIIINFWFRQVLFHYGVIVIIAIVPVIPFGGNWQLILSSLFLASCISFLTLTIFYYWPTYYSDFLPKLDTIISEHEKQAQALEEVKKCKRTQFSIPTLTIIFYLFSKVGNVPFPACNDRSAELLNKLYGVDKDKLKENLSRLYKLSRLSPKERAEIQKGIDNARIFFEELGYLYVGKILNDLELKLNRA